MWMKHWLWKQVFLLCNMHDESCTRPATLLRKYKWSQFSFYVVFNQKQALNWILCSCGYIFSLIVIKKWERDWMNGWVRKRKKESNPVPVLTAVLQLLVAPAEGEQLNSPGSDLWYGGIRGNGLWACVAGTILPLRAERWALSSTHRNVLHQEREKEAEEEGEGWKQRWGKERNERERGVEKDQLQDIPINIIEMKYISQMTTVVIIILSKIIVIINLTDMQWRNCDWVFID